MPFGINLGGGGSSDSGSSDSGSDSGGNGGGGSIVDQATSAVTNSTEAKVAENVGSTVGGFFGGGGGSSTSSSGGDSGDSSGSGGGTDSGSNGSSGGNDGLDAALSHVGGYDPEANAAEDPISSESKGFNTAEAFAELNPRQQNRLTGPSDVTPFGPSGPSTGDVGTVRTGSESDMPSNQDGSPTVTPGDAGPMGSGPEIVERVRTELMPLVPGMGRRPSSGGGNNGNTDPNRPQQASGDSLVPGINNVTLAAAAGLAGLAAVVLGGN